MLILSILCIFMLLGNLLLIIIHFKGGGGGPMGIFCET